MTNPKIEKVKANITKTKATIAEQQAKLRDLEKQKIRLENDEVVALFRREKMNEDEFAELLRSNAKGNQARDDTEAAPEEPPKPKADGREENSDDSDKN